MSKKFIRIGRIFFVSILVLVMSGGLAGCGREPEEMFCLDSLGKTEAAWENKEETVGFTSGEIPVEESSPALIYVFVCGAVNRPGVVELPEGSRAEAGVVAAGGMREDADADYVNLAAPLTDGEKLYIPTAEEGMALEQGDAGGSGLVNINTADAALLCTLPGIGESRASDIIAYREKNGVFSRIEDLMKVPGIKEGAFGKLKDLITV